MKGKIWIGIGVALVVILGAVGIVFGSHIRGIMRMAKSATMDDEAIAAQAEENAQVEQDIRQKYSIPDFELTEEMRTAIANGEMTLEEATRQMLAGSSGAGEDSTPSGAGGDPTPSSAGEEAPAPADSGETAQTDSGGSQAGEPAVTTAEPSGESGGQSAGAAWNGGSQSAGSTGNSGGSQSAGNTGNSGGQSAGNTGNSGGQSAGNTGSSGSQNTGNTGTSGGSQNAGNTESSGGQSAGAAWNGGGQSAGNTGNSGGQSAGNTGTGNGQSGEAAGNGDSQTNPASGGDQQEAEAKPETAGGQTDEQRIQTLITQLYVLRDTFLGKGNDILDECIAEFNALDPSEQTTAAKVRIVSARLGEVSALEDQCDAQVQQIVDEIRTMDPDLADEVLSRYESEKAVTKASIIAQYR